MTLPPTAAAIALAVVGALIVGTTGQGTRAGAIAGLGVAVFAILGLGPGALLPLAIFVLVGGALTRLGRARKLAAGAAEANQGRRGVSHVAAKLGIPALLGIAGLLTNDGYALSLAYASALAGALADTSGTEVGPLGSGHAMGLHGLRLRRMPHGTPGAVSATGLAASAVGAAAVASGGILSGLIVGVVPWGIATLAGFVASLFESGIAATPPGRRLGHFGRNAMVSLIASAIGFWAGASGWGRP